MKENLIFFAFATLFFTTALAELDSPFNLTPQNPFLKSSVVKLSVEGSYGIGFITEANNGTRYIISNAHVCLTTDSYKRKERGLRGVRVEFRNGFKHSMIVDFNLSYINFEEDFCAFRLGDFLSSMDFYNPLELANFDDQQSVITLDYDKVKSSVVPASSIERDNTPKINDDDWYGEMLNSDNTILIDGECRRGMSGTPVFNKNERVVAFINGCRDFIEGRNLASRLEIRSLDWARENELWAY